MERLVLVHGSVVGPEATWRGQRPLPPGPPVERVDFEIDAGFVADQIEPGDHLVGHSYGGVVCLLSAARRPQALGSLTVIEPPATRVALDVPAVAEFAEGGARLWAEGPRDDPEAFPPFLLERTPLVLGRDHGQAHARHHEQADDE